MILYTARQKETGWGNRHLLKFSSVAIKWKWDTGKTYLNNSKGHHNPSSFLATCWGMTLQYSATWVHTQHENFWCWFLTARIGNGDSVTLKQTQETWRFACFFKNSLKVTVSKYNLRWRNISWFFQETQWKTRNCLVQSLVTPEKTWS